MSQKIRGAFDVVTGYEDVTGTFELVIGLVVAIGTPVITLCDVPMGTYEAVLGAAVVIVTGCIITGLAEGTTMC